MNKKVLIACEESQRVTEEFRKRGFEAYSCDLIPTSGSHPEWHIQQDVLPLLNGNCEFTTCDRQKHKIDGKWTAIIAHPPCFVAGTMIMTYEGLKPIEQVQVGDKVLTHKGRYKTVKKTFVKETNETVIVHAENCGYIECTSNHPFYTRKMKRIYQKDKKKYARILGDFEWISPNDFEITRKSCGDIIERTYLTNVVDNAKEIPVYDGCEIGVNKYKTKHVKTLKVDDPNFWYLVGRWLGDGWHGYKKRGQTHGYFGIFICCSFEEKEELEEKIKLTGLNYCLRKENTTYRFEIDNKELSNFMRQFGEYSYGKKIPGFVTRLTDVLADAFLNGYFDADGYRTDKDIYTYSSISKNVAYGIKYMVNKYWRVGCSIKKYDRSNNNMIEGRKCKIQPIYTGHFRKNKRNQSHYIIENNYMFTEYSDIKKIEKNCLVYNLSVEDDESYTANGLVVHNCTDLSVSGAMHFKKKRKDGRQRQSIEFFCQFLKADCDHIAIENPVNIISGEYVKEWFPDLCTKYRLPLKPSQKIHPWMFGDNYSKATCLWLKGFPLLEPEVMIEPELEWFEWVDKKTGKKKRQPKWYYEALVKAKTTQERGCIRSKTFPGIARAFAEQWGDYLLDENK